MYILRGNAFMHRVWDSTRYSVSAWFNPHLLAAASSYPLKPHVPLSSYWGDLPCSQECLSMCWLQLWAEGPFFQISGLSCDSLFPNGCLSFCAICSLFPLVHRDCCHFLLPSHSIFSRLGVQIQI